MLSRRRSTSLVTLIALLICFALLSSGFAPFAIGEAKSFSWTGQGQSEKPKPVPGAPGANLPNLDEIRARHHPAPYAPASIPSTMRSRRNPLAPRNGRRVGDPLPPPSQGAANNTGNGSEQVNTGSAGVSPAMARRSLAKEMRDNLWERRSLSALGGGKAAGGSAQRLGSSPTVREGVGARASLTEPLLTRGLLPLHAHHAHFVPRSNALANARGAAPPSLFESQILPNFFPALAAYAFLPGLRAAIFGSLPSSLPPQAPSTKIAFASNREGSGQIYFMNTDGSNQTRLTISAANDEWPRWSPNNSRILFQSDRDNPFSCLSEIYVMNADGSGQTRLTNGPADDSAAVWSPDGSKIAFQSARNGLYYQVYVMNADGTGQVNLSNSVTNDGQPSWSSDGTRIAFTSERDHPGTPGIYVMNADGSNQTRLTFSSSEIRDEQPMWSPDGMKIAFFSTRDSVVETWQETDDEGGILVRTRVRTNKEVYVMNADGSNQLRLTNTLENDDSPVWSADGTKILFRRDRERESWDPVAQVWMMNADGSNQVDLSNNCFDDFCPSWQHASGNISPAVSITSPANGATFTAPANITITANASDSDGTISKVDFYQGTALIGTDTTTPYSIDWNNVALGTYSLTAKATDNAGGLTTSAAVSITVNPNQSSVNQYIQNLHQWALLRQPNANESSYWNDMLRAAYAHGQGSMILALRELGKTIFESSEYAARSRPDRDYVYDLYKTFLMREPDQQGWDNWTAAVPLYGRDHVRRGFDESTEFLNLVSTLTTSGTPSSVVSSLASARVDPFNQPGSGLLARDTEWSVPLLSLPGRAGLDLGLSLSYSSMVWTRSGPYVYFDEDNGFPSPGFRLGFPTIQEKVFDAQAGVNVYLLAAAGSRVELRQVGLSNVYEAADSSYLQLIDNGSLLVRTTDGTQLSYGWFNQEYRCTEIKDRNGNYLTVNYDWLGHVTTITDTLGRVITFNYDANANLISITQTWTVNGVPTTHTWATFGWGTQAMQASFPGAAVVGAESGSVIPVLAQVGLDDGTHYNFEYNSSVQVNVIRSYRSDNVQRAYTAFNYESPADDCPRLSATRLWAENWTGINGVPSEVTAQYTVDGDGAHLLTAPDGTIYKEYYGSGWQKGLTTQTEVWSGGVRQKWTTTAWTQDNTGVNYQTNPRVTETNIYDAEGNRRRATIGYQTFTLPSGASCSLPNDVYEYAADAVTVLRRTVTYIETSATYTDRRIIGLPWLRTVSDGAGNLLSKVDFNYDWGGGYMVSQGQPVQHDETNYGSGLLAGRGNLVVMRQFDVNDPNNNSLTHDTRIGYNTAGSVIFKGDASWHTIGISYTDSFSDSLNRNTFAYPTTITDPEGFSSSAQYNFDFGATTRVQGAPAAGQAQGAVQTFAYDSAGRIERVTMTDNGAYTRHVYGPNYVQSFSSVNNVADDAYSIQVFDGAGQVIGAANNHPGSSGGYSMVNMIYDLMGRAVKRSNPTEINSSWIPVGDDAAGMFYTQHTYDWKGRPLVTTNTDNTTKQASYGGCGCAGGEVVTLTDEVGRRQKAYSDVLGRTAKSEVLNWDGSVYSAATNTYNGRDQVTLARQYAGAEGSGSYQDTAMTYDGYGRLQTKHAPEQNAGTATVYSYNNDDTVYSVTDARGATCTYGYNGRHLVTSATHTLSGQSTIATSYSYDAAGNRTSMTDGSGSVSYNYNELSRMTSETRIFNNVGSFTLSYQYNLAGELTSITDPFGAQVGYVHDQTGRLNAVSGSGFGNVTQYASAMQYRAWNGLKHLSYEDNNDPRSLSISYTPRMQVNRFELTYTGVNPAVSGVELQHHADGHVSYSRELNSTIQDRAYSYDHLGRITQALSGAEARGEPGADVNFIPFRQNYQYDVWDNMTSRTGQHWGQNVAALSAAFVNNRNQAWTYDQEGRVTQEASRHYIYDAVGRLISATEPPRRAGRPALTTTQQYDGDGRRVRSTDNSSVVYEVRSTVLAGQVVSDVNSQGQKVTGYVYANGGLLARQIQTSGDVVWVHRSPDGTGQWESSSHGWPGRTVELDPLADDVGLDNPYYPEGGGDGLGGYPNFGDPTDLSAGCALDGSMIPCEIIGKVISRNQDKFLSMIISGRIGARVSHQGVTETFDGESILIGSGSQQATNGDYTAYVTVQGTPGILQASSIGYSMMWLNLQPTQYSFAAPQNSGQQAKYGNLEKCQRSYLPEEYPEGKPQPTDLAIGLALDGGLNDTGDSAMILALWAKESSFDPRPRNDHGPLQLTSWWSNYSNRNNLNLIVPGAYDSFGRPEGSANRDRRFQGKISANVMTAGNIIRHSRTALGQSYYQIGYGYGPGPDKATRNDYATHAARLQNRYASFINCLKTGQ